MVLLSRSLGVVWFPPTAERHARWLECLSERVSPVIVALSPGTSAVVAAQLMDNMSATQVNNKGVSKI